MFRWRLFDAGGVETGESEGFPDREAAEAWLSETWAVLVADGVDEVALDEDGETVYRMSLREA